MTCSLAFLSLPIITRQAHPFFSSLRTPRPPRHDCPCQQHKLQLFGKESDDDEDAFLQQELARLESLGDVDDDDDSFLIHDDWFLMDDLFEFLPEDADPQELEEFEQTFLGLQLEPRSAETLEEALLQGVVPANAGVGSGCLAGDFGFDPLHISQKDYIGIMQRLITNLIPGGDYTDSEESVVQRDRPSALVLRDYREAEIRHGRLAMLAAVFWPLQEMLDRLLLDDFGSVIGNLFSSGITLPYIPLIMTAIMLLLGYLDIYSKAIKDMDAVGEAFLPGDCFWDPLKILDGTPGRMKRNMQERELFNGRMAMLAIAVFIWEETITKQPLISVPGNELVFEPAYQIPYIQEWLDAQFGSGSAPPPSFVEFNVVEGFSLDDISGME